MNRVLLPTLLLHSESAIAKNEARSIPISEVKTRKEWRCFMTGEIIRKGSTAYVIELDQNNGYNSGIYPAKLYFSSKEAVSLFKDALARYSTLYEALSSQKSSKLSRDQLDFFREIIVFCESVNNHFLRIVSPCSDLNPDLKNGVENGPLTGNPSNLLIKNAYNRIWNIERVMRDRVSALRRYFQSCFFQFGPTGELDQTVSDWFYESEKPERARFTTHGICIEILLAHNGMEVDDAIGLFSRKTNATLNIKAKASGIYSTGSYSSTSLWEPGSGIPLIFEVSELAVNPERTRLHEFKHLIDTALTGSTTELSAHLFTDDLTRYWSRPETKAEIDDLHGTSRSMYALARNCDISSIDYLLTMNGISDGAKSFFISLFPELASSINSTFNLEEQLSS